MKKGTRRSGTVVCGVALACGLSSCVAMHHRNPIRQKIEYNRVTRRIEPERLARVKETEEALLDRELGTGEARLEGVFVGRTDEGTRGGEVLIATQNFNTIEFTEREQLPYELDERLIIDVATLVSREPETCVDLVLNSDALYDMPIEELLPLFEIDSEEVETWRIEQEHVTEPISMWYEKRTRLFWKVEEVFDQRRRVARLCAPQVARSVVTLTLFNELYSVRAGEYWKLSFRWSLSGR